MKKILPLFFVFVSSLYGQEPRLDWVRLMGGSTTELPHTIVRDVVGNTYIAGTFAGQYDFAPGPDTAILLSTDGSLDIFILKLDDTGGFDWVKRIGGIGHDRGHALAADSSGNIYLAGEFRTPGMSILKLDPAGNELWSITINSKSSGNVIPFSLATDQAGHLYIAGSFVYRADFDPGPDSAFREPNPPHDADAFILKLQANGAFGWVHTFSGRASGLSVDRSNNIYTTGFFGGTADFDPSPDSAVFVAQELDCYILKLTSTGGYLWTRILSGAYDQEGVDIVTDREGNSYTAGKFFTLGVLGSDTVVTSISDNIEPFILKLTSTGEYAWAIRYEDYGLRGLGAIRVDQKNHVYHGGWFVGNVDFDPSPNTVTLSSSGRSGFVTKFDSTGALEWAKQLSGPSSNCYVYGIALDGVDDVYLSGTISGMIDFDPSVKIDLDTAQAHETVFVTKWTYIPLAVKPEHSGSSTELVVYPNPASTKFVIQLDEDLSTSQIEIVDVMGKVVYSVTVFNEGNFVVDRRFPVGIYMVKATNNKNVRTCNMIIN